MTAQGKPARRPAHTSIWYCEDCKTKGMAFEKMWCHMKDVHGFDPMGLKVRKRMLFHLDEAQYFSSQWEVTVPKPGGGTVTLTHSTCTRRSKDDPMRHEEDE